MRQAIIERSTKETSLKVALYLDQPGRCQIKMGLPFFEHMLHAMAFHGGFGFEISGQGDLEVDPHHLVEDTGIVLGQAFAQALGDSPVQRYGHAIIPMDDALSEATVDFCRRSYLVFNANFPQDRSGNFDMFLFREFFQALANKAEINLHLNCRYGINSHHMIEALFKSLGKALYQGSRLIAAEQGVLSTKGYI
jgi:imidazoleglycerol-phosphate dehydratase